MKNDQLLKQNEIRDEWETEFGRMLLDLICRNYGIGREKVMKTQTCIRCKKDFPTRAMIDGEFVQLKRTVCLDCRPYKKKRTLPKRVIT